MANAPSTASDAHKKSKKPKPEKGEKAESSTVKKDKKRKNKSQDENEAGRVEAVAQPPTEDSERPKKKQRTEDSTSAESADTPATKPPKRPKRPKDKAAKKLAQETPDPKDKIVIVDVPVPYTNPLTDDSLSDLSQRGLAYAYQYAQHESLSEHDRATKRPWKFNKARQNWILRNVVDVVTIPDSYLGLALIYVGSIQGGARDALKKTCKTTKKQAKATKAKSKAQGESASVEDDSASKKVTFAADAVSLDAPASPSKEKYKRAKIILKVLKGKIKPQDI